MVSTRREGGSSVGGVACRTLTTAAAGTVLAASIAIAVVPLETTPSYESTPLGHRATGGAWADVDGDGWLDMVVANGNDMARQNVVVYHNNGDGTLPLTPTWSSVDIDFHGHLDVGDINGDGWLDVACAVYCDDTGGPGTAKVYLNDGAGALSARPAWMSAVSFDCFSVALGDADGDADLDLACATGNLYGGQEDYPRVFINDGTMLESTPSWEGAIPSVASDVFWGDFDNDGDLDLVLCGFVVSPTRVYRNDQTDGGGLMTTPIWENVDFPPRANTTAFGDWNDDGYLELAVADNNQLGGPGSFKVYGNEGGVLSQTPSWTSSTQGEGSHVSWVDIDLDDDPDLATGRWFDRARVYENVGGTLSGDPTWESATTSVIENMFWGDVDNDGLRPDGLALATGDGARTLFRLGEGPVRSIDEVRVNGLPLGPGQCVAHLTYGWISLAVPPPLGAAVEIQYTYSVDLDLGVTNWDDDKGNYVFTNTTTIDVPDLVEARAGLRVEPNPVRRRTVVCYRGGRAEYASVTVHGVDGRCVRTLHEGAISGGPIRWEWDVRDDAGRRAASGVYLVRLQTATDRQVTRLVVLRERP